MCCKCNPYEEKIELKFWREDERAVMPVIAYEGTSACFDLICIEDTIVPAGGTAMVPNGLRMVIPNGWYVEFATRSGHGIKHNLSCHAGIIDAGYLGPLQTLVRNHSSTDVTIKAGTGAVQCKLHKVRPVQFTEITKEEFDNTETIRGHNGFGSSDKK